ncbi:MAG: hypothetical protein HQ523_16895 [Lentisphaerae bacterium]|nr:hypothetical protein [Lentisphaerota bacterium]
MTSPIVVLTASLAVPTALVLNPWLLVRCLLPRAKRDMALATMGLTIFLLNFTAPCLLHLFHIPIDQPHLAIFHFLLLLVLAISLGLAGRSLLPQGVLPPSPQPWLLCLLLAILVFPFTHMAGIDTYKWQDLATNVAVEQNIPWLVHPLALAGFAPRSYPSLHPLLQASMGILGQTGVDAAFWLTSIAIGFTAIFTMMLLASLFSSDPSRQVGLAAMYVLSPVFMRYVHWGTGRGVYLALLPLFVWGLLNLRHLSGWCVTVVTALALILAHKAGIPTIMLLLPAMGMGLLLPTRRSWTAPLLITLCLAVGLLLSPRYGLHGPAGHLLGFVMKDVLRLGWMGPFLVAGIFLYPASWNRPSIARPCLAALLATFPLAHHKEMYGAMLALPFVCLAAWRPLLQLIENAPRFRTVILKTAAILTVAGGLVIVIQRSIQATPARVYEAAMFIEQTNPIGPFRIVSSQRHGIHIQGYVSGCPRFSVHMAESNAQAFALPPLQMDGPLRARASRAIDYLRGFLNPPGVSADWYGGAKTVYHIILDDESLPPSRSRLIYSQDGVTIFEETLP